MTAKSTAAKTTDRVLPGLPVFMDPEPGATWKERLRERCAGAGICLASGVITMAVLGILLVGIAWALME